MLNNKKRVFWEAFLLTVVVFIFGLLIGISFENKKLNEVNDYYLKSEISLMDILAVNNLAGDNSSCEFLIKADLDLADRIYDEAFILEKYEKAGKVTESLKLLHEKYDVLRTFLWINTMKTYEKCGESFNVVVYLYEYEVDNLEDRARQSTWSKILFDLKQEMGDELILIPIATDNELASLEFLTSNLNLSEKTSVIVNNEFVITELSSVEGIKKYLV